MKWSADEIYWIFYPCILREHMPHKRMKKVSTVARILTQIFLNKKVALAC